MLSFCIGIRVLYILGLDFVILGCCSDWKWYFVFERRVCFLFVGDCGIGLRWYCNMCISMLIVEYESLRFVLI